jgi:hypothetical protein
MNNNCNAFYEDLLLVPGFNVTSTCPACKLLVLSHTHRPLAAPPPISSPCEICDANNPLVQVSASCKHKNKYCQDCIRKHISASMDGKGSVTNIQCPDSECKKMMDSTEVIIHLKGDSALLNKADRLLFLAYLRSQDNFRWCCNPSGCGSGAELEGGADSYSFLQCHDCGMRTCVTHRVPWHAGMTCAEFDEQLRNDHDESSEAWKLANTKMCPNCFRNIEKSDGCDVMACCTYGDETCKKTRTSGRKCDHGGLCGQRFCWLCLGPIDQDGTRHHKDSCRFNFG